MKFLSTIAAALLAATAVSAKKPCKEDKFTCPKDGNLPKDYVKPNLIIPVSRKAPDQVFGSSDYGLVTPGDFCTITTLELPPYAYTKICRLVVLFPDHDQTNDYYVYSGPGRFNFTGYAINSKAYASNTTYNNQPEVGPSPPSPPFIGPGNAYTIFELQCPVPPNVASTVGGIICSEDTTWNYKQSSKKCPLGFFVELLDPPST